MLSISNAVFISVCLAPFVSATTYMVSVGKNEITGKKGTGFDPSVVNPVVGDIISFTFESGSHSVVQSTFDHPCTPSGAFDSGAHSIPDSTALGASGIIAQYYINDTIPQCGQCQQGAVLAVNPTGDQNVTAFKANAAKDTPPASSTVSSTNSATGSATASASKKTNAAMARYDVAVSGAAVMFLATLSLLD